MFGPGLEPDAIRAVNTYDVTGHMRRRTGQTLEEALVERLTTVCLLKRFTPRQQLVVRMLCENYKQSDVAHQLGLSLRTVNTLVRQVRESMSAGNVNCRRIPVAA